MCNLWACACNFPVREVCQFLFQQLVVSWSFSCVSVALRVLWHCYKPLSSVLSLWPPGTQTVPFLSVLWVMWVRNQSLRQPSEKLECLMCVSLFSSSPKGGATSWALSPQLQWAVLVSLCSVTGSLVLPQAAELFFVLCCSQASKVCCSSSVLWVRWDRSHSLERPAKSQTADVCSTVSSPFQGKSYRLGFSSQLWAVPSLGRGWHGCNEMTFITSFNAFLFGF